MMGLPSQRTESVLHGMVAAFEFFQAVAREVWWDNPKTIATVVLKGRERVLNGNYAALASHYRFDPRACMPARGQEKPDAESGVKAYIDRIEVVVGDKVIAAHVRSRGRCEWVVDPLHYVAALSVRPHALDHSRMFKDWMLPGIFNELRERLEREHGRNAGIRQYVRVLQLLTEHPAGRLGESIRRLWHRLHLRSEHIQDKAHQIASEGSTPSSEASTLCQSDSALVMKNESSPARQTEAPDADAQSPIETGVVKNATIIGAHPLLSVQVPRPDLRRFNQLLPSFQPGESHDEYLNPIPAAGSAAATQPQGAEVTHHAGRA
jgi:hypothetical protein